MGTSWIALLVAAAAVSLTPTASLAGITPTGTLVVVAARLDDKPFPQNKFFAELTVDLDLTSGPVVTGVQLVIDGGTPIDLERDSPLEDEWFSESEWSDLATMKDDLDGTWVITLEVFMGTNIVSQFDFDAASLTEGDLYQVPTITNPTHNEAGVDGGTTLTWTNPTIGAATPHVLVLEADNDTNDDESASREDDSFLGDIEIDATSWDPDGGILPGLTEFSVSYFADGRDFVSTVSVDPPGSITWEPSPFSPLDYPADEPLLALGSEAIIAFSVPAVDDFESYGIQTGTARSIAGVGTVYFIDESTSEDYLSVSQSLADGTAILADPTNSLSWSLESATGQTGTLGGGGAPLNQDGLVMIGDLPAASDRTTAGPFSDFFGSDPNAREPKNLWNAWVSVRAREVTKAQVASYRMVLTDAQGQQVASDEFQLDDDVFQWETAWTQDFTNGLTPGQFDGGQVVGVSLAVLTTPGGGTPVLEVHVDEVNIEFVPEPGAWQLGLAAFAALGVVARRRHKA